MYLCRGCKVAVDSPVQYLENSSALAIYSPTRLERPDHEANTESRGWYGTFRGTHHRAAL
jgi:hypothetical protein